MQKKPNSRKPKRGGKKNRPSAAKEVKIDSDFKYGSPPPNLPQMPMADPQLPPMPMPDPKLPKVPQASLSLNEGDLPEVPHSSDTDGFADGSFSSGKADPLVNYPGDESSIEPTMDSNAPSQSIDSLVEDLADALIDSEVEGDDSVTPDIAPVEESASSPVSVYSNEARATSTAEDDDHMKKSSSIEAIAQVVAEKFNNKQPVDQILDMAEASSPKNVEREQPVVSDKVEVEADPDGSLESLEPESVAFENQPHESAVKIDVLSSATVSSETFTEADRDIPSEPQKNDTPATPQQNNYEGLLPQAIDRSASPSDASPLKSGKATTSADTDHSPVHSSAPRSSDTSSKLSNSHASTQPIKPIENSGTGTVGQIISDGGNDETTEATRRPQSRIKPRSSLPATLSATRTPPRKPRTSMITVSPTAGFLKPTISSSLKRAANKHQAANSHLKPKQSIADNVNAN